MNISSISKYLKKEGEKYHWLDECYREKPLILPLITRNNRLVGLGYGSNIIERFINSLKSISNTTIVQYTTKLIEESDNHCTNVIMIPIYITYESSKITEKRINNQLKDVKEILELYYPKKEVVIYQPKITLMCEYTNKLRKNKDIDRYNKMITDFDFKRILTYEEYCEGRDNCK